MFVIQGLSDVKRLVVGDKNYHERCLFCQVTILMCCKYKRTVIVNYFDVLLIVAVQYVVC